MELVIQPTGKTISALPGCNLLTCLIEHKIPISYSCQDGRCGMCACKLLDGSVIEAGKRANEVPTTPRDQILACQTVLTEGCAVSIPDQESATTHQPRIFLAQIDRIERFSDTVRQIHLTPQSSFSFSPGQHVEIEFAPNLVRRYSMAGIAADPELRIHVNLAAGGAASEYVRKTLKVGDHLKIRGPLGSTFLRQQSKEPMIVLAAGVGLAAVLSILRGMVETRNMNLTMVGIYFSKEADVYGIDELNDLVSALPNARKQLMVAFGEPYSHGVRQGLITDWIRTACGALDDWRAYAFGSVVPVESAVRQLRRKGIPGSRLHVETYYPMSGR